MTSIINAFENLLSSVFQIFQSLFNTALSALQSVFAVFSTLLKDVFQLFEGLIEFLFANILIIGLVVGSFIAYGFYQRGQGRAVTTGKKTS